MAPVAEPALRTTAALDTKVNAPRFGTHLTLDGYGAEAAKLGDMHLVFTSLDEIPDLLRMKKIITPYVVYYGGNGKKDLGGYSGVVMIAESHISIHTFPSEGFVSIDVYTCQGDLDVETARSYFADKFGVKEWEENVIKRGTKYIRN